MNGAEIIAEILRREGTERPSCYPRNPLIEACAAIGIRLFNRRRSPRPVSS